jgi:hypothetical protein
LLIFSLFDLDLGFLFVLFFTCICIFAMSHRLCLLSHAVLLLILSLCKCVVDMYMSAICHLPSPLCLRFVSSFTTSNCCSYCLLLLLYKKYMLISILAFYYFGAFWHTTRWGPWHLNTLLASTNVRHYYQAFSITQAKILKIVLTTIPVPDTWWLISNPREDDS